MDDKTYFNTLLPGIEVDEGLRDRLLKEKPNVWLAAAAALRVHVTWLVSTGALEDVKADDFTLSGGSKTLDALLDLADKYEEIGDGENAEAVVLVHTVPNSKNDEELRDGWYF